MKKIRNERITRFVKVGACTLLSTAAIVGISAVNRTPSESTIVLSSIPERSISAPTEYEGNSDIIENSADPPNIVPPETQNSGSASEKQYLINLNTATSRQLQTLSGIGEAKAAAIIEYRETHGGFSDISELLNVDGIGEQIYENIGSYVTVGDVTQQTVSSDTSEQPPKVSVVNINTASLEELQTLPGIGAAKAMAIVQYRSVFGGFSDISEVKNVNGIGESVFEDIRDLITTGGYSVPSAPDTSDTTGDIMININTATAEELRALPGIGEAKSKAIIQYRDIYGEFSDIEEIKNVSGIGEKLFEGIRDHITVGDRSQTTDKPTPDLPPDEPLPDGTSKPGQNALVNLNTAAAEELMTLPDIGEDKAAAILKYRSVHGGFSDIREIMNISGINENTFAKLRYMITV